MSYITALNSKYESNGDPGAIGYDNLGGWSYGRNQIATKVGTFKAFLKFLKGGYPGLYQELERVGGNDAALSGTPEFKSTWKRLAVSNRDEFIAAQEGFMIATHYDVVVSRLASAGYDLTGRSKTLCAVLFSHASAAGPGSPKVGGSGACGLFVDAVNCYNKSFSEITDEEIISAMYQKKLQRIDSKREYANLDEKLRASVRRRFVRESVDAERMLRCEREGKVA